MTFFHPCCGITVKVLVRTWSLIVTVVGLMGFVGALSGFRTSRKTTLENKFCLVFWVNLVNSTVCVLFAVTAFEYLSPYFVLPYIVVAGILSLLMLSGAVSLCIRKHVVRQRRDLPGSLKDKRFLIYKDYRAEPPSIADAGVKLPICCLVLFSFVTIFFIVVTVAFYLEYSEVKATSEKNFINATLEFLSTSPSPS